jgi:hypothetical protein
MSASFGRSTTGRTVSPAPAPTGPAQKHETVYHESIYAERMLVPADDELDAAVRGVRLRGGPREHAQAHACHHRTGERAALRAGAGIEVMDDGCGGRKTRIRSACLADRVTALIGSSHQPCRRRYLRPCPPGAACPAVARAASSMRIVLAEDSVLFREGLTRLLVEAGHDVVASVADAKGHGGVVGRHRLEEAAEVDARGVSPLPSDRACSQQTRRAGCPEPCRRGLR